MLKQIQKIQQGQKLLPKIVLIQNILGIPAIALDNIVRRELELNPLLEDGPELESDVTDDALTNDEWGQPDEMEMRQNPSPASSDENSIKSEEESTEEREKEEEFGWDEYFENETDDVSANKWEQQPAFDYGNISFVGNNMYDSLLLQLHLSDISPKQQFVTEEVLFSLNDDGFFTEEPEALLADLEESKEGTEFENDVFSPDDIDAAIEFIQANLDPPGIGARNLKECLIIQIERGKFSNQLKALASEAVSMHFDDIINKRYEKLEKALNVSPEIMKDVFELLHKLNPKPGLAHDSSPENYIVPDLIVKSHGGHYEVYLNERFTPSLRINNSYKNMYVNHKDSLDRNTKDYLYKNFNKAKWFIEAINSRRETMIKMMEAIIARQKDFFDSAGEILKPMLEKEIAQDINMDSSTVSRAVKNKYVQTDFGIYELRSFFSNSMQTADGDDVSTSEIKGKLKELIINEDKDRPLTDLELSRLLANDGYNVARRTISKYRESLGLPMAKLRREITKIN